VPLRLVSSRLLRDPLARGSPRDARRSPPASENGSLMHENETVRSSIKISLWRNEKERAAERDARRRSAPNSEFIESWISRTAMTIQEDRRGADSSLTGFSSFFFRFFFLPLLFHYHYKSRDRQSDPPRAESRERERFFVHFFELFIVKRDKYPQSARRCARDRSTYESKFTGLLSSAARVPRRRKFSFFTFTTAETYAEHAN